MVINSRLGHVVSNRRGYCVPACMVTGFGAGRRRRSEKKFRNRALFISCSVLREYFSRINERTESVGPTIKAGDRVLQDLRTLLFLNEQAPDSPL